MFPDGRLPSKRWLPVAWLAAADLVLLSIAFGFASSGSFAVVPNPFTIPSAESLLEALQVIGAALTVVVKHIEQLRRHLGAAGDLLTSLIEGVAAGSVTLDPTTHAIHCGGVTESLTPTEFRLLAALASRPDEVLRRRELVEAAWPVGAIVHDNTLDVYLARLRRKLRYIPDSPRIATIQRVGYSLRWPESD